jgi:hypothetical protein
MASMTDKESSLNVLVTTLAHVGLLVIGLFFLFIGTYSILLWGNCANVSCDSGPFANALVLVRAGVWVPFGLSVVVSVVLMVRRKAAWYVPAAATIVIVACVVAGMFVANYAMIAALTA